ncbi:TetR/AcrR family transcriptional regulator [Actinocorallia populi]|uniref:TetR/AcrR family transcriptional regulator n=1 Tax=Actinocorallia populi TaxID=2079200 RepID=UPI000D09129D|nr:TetR/AcrR family transcriptional regulator [Actinocorallia populi]
MTTTGPAAAPPPGSKTGERSGGTRRRADAERSIAAIVGAATELFALDPGASMVDVARAAGVGRVTLYAHFASREDLVRQVLAGAIARSMAAIEAATTDGQAPAEAFARVMRACWSQLNQFGRLYEAAEQALPAEEVRHHHRTPMAYVRDLIREGQATGDFRGDLPADWLVATVYALLHTAAAEVAAGRLADDESGTVVEKTLLSVLAHPVR